MPTTSDPDEFLRRVLGTPRCYSRGIDHLDIESLNICNCPSIAGGNEHMHVQGRIKEPKT